MTLELIVFIASLLFGAFLYWRESQSNRLYRFFNKLMYSKELQMKPEDKKGFVYQKWSVKMSKIKVSTRITHFALPLRPVVFTGLLLCVFVMGSFVLWIQETGW